MSGGRNASDNVMRADRSLMPVLRRDGLEFGDLAHCEMQKPSPPIRDRGEKFDLSPNRGKFPGGLDWAQASIGPMRAARGGILSPGMLSLSPMKS